MSKHSTQDMLKLLQGTTDMIASYMHSIDARDRKVIDFYQPDDLRDIFDFAISGEWSSDDQIFAALQDVLDKSVATMHPRFFNQLYAGANIYSIIAEHITAVLNTSMYTYEVGPLFTLMEEYVFGRIAQMVWWAGPHDGLMLPGGSNSNLYALQMARYALDPSINTTWLYNHQKLVILTSDESHYSLTKSAMLTWLGKDAIIKIETDDAGKMIPSALQAKILEVRESGAEVCMINATSGTTVMWAYDPLSQIAAIAKQHNIRLHVDMIRWGTVMFDDELKNKIEGIELVDSFAWNPHKMMWASMQCSVWMTQRPDVTAQCNVLKTQYLFQDDKWYDIWCDTGDKYTQCGRRVDVLKLRLMRKALWDQWVASNVRKAFDDARYLTEQVAWADQLYMYHQPECTNINFWYIPSDLTLPGTSHADNLTYIKTHYDRIHPLTAQIKDRMLERGEMMTWYAHTKWYPNFFRMITISPKVTKEDLDFVVSHIQELGRELE